MSVTVQEPLKGSNGQSRVAKSLLDARRELIDLSRRNRLLHTPRTGSRPHCLEILAADPNTLFVGLSRENKKFPFAPGSERPAEETIAADDEVHTAPVSRSNALQTKLDAEKLERKLYKLYLEARTFEEEQGVSILFLAMGFLNWFEEERSEIQSSAPLLLVPVALERKQGRDPFVLHGREDDMMMNVSLAEKLRGDFGIALPDLPEGDEWLPSEYLSAVAAAIAAQKRWTIDDHGIGLGFFTFSKFLMWRDLDSSTWPKPNDLLMHGLVGQLIGEAIPDDDNVGPLVSDEEPIDQHIDIASATHVVDADSSQAVCIEEARRGRNLVIQGPPGTGKSQTITNIIASAVNEGKTVLFVAEKAAALEVVSSRLKNVGLEPLCLEIHSKKSTKAAVIGSLERAMRAGGAALQASKNAGDLRMARDRLNDWSAVLHRQIRSTGRTPYQVMGTILKLRGDNVRVLSERIDDAADWDAAKLDEIDQAVQRAAAGVERLGVVPVQHPWFGTGGGRLNPLVAERLKADLEESRKQLKEISALCAQAAAVLKAQSGQTIATIRLTLESLNWLASVPVKGRENLKNDIWKTGRPGIEELCKNGKLWCSTKTELSPALAETAWSTETAPTRDAIAKLGGSWVRFFSGKYRRAVTELKSLYKEKPPREREQQLAVLDKLIAAQLARKKVSEGAELGQNALGAYWAVTETDWGTADRLISWSNKAGQLDPDLVERGADVDHEVCGSIASKLQTAVEAFSRAFAKVRECAQPNPQILFAVPDLEQADLVLVSNTIERWITGLPSFDEWVQARESIGKLDQLGLRIIAEQLRTGGISPAEASGMVEILLAEALWGAACADNQELDAIDGAERTRLVDLFCNLDRKRIQLTRSEVLTGYLSRKPDGTTGEMEIVRHEIGKKRRHLPIRKLMEKAGLAVQGLKPVFLMSPMSVAEFLPAGRLRFDLVVMDEASQVRPEDAFGVIARGRHLVVVGDSKQLPPTNFFRMVSEDDEEDSEDDNEQVRVRPEDFESILKLFSARGAPERMLNWHYRSKHPSLIALSNQRCYGGRLLLPPSPGADGEDLGLHLVKTPSGHYERGGSGCNLVEADIIAEAVEEHLKKSPNRSLGIASFSVAQREAIYEALRRKGIGHETETFAPKNERLFVKNLEAVQGDERDVIFISIGYGKDANGQMSANFGPLSKDGGERRMNVLISRARERCVVFSSITSGDISVGSTAKGTQMLRAFLDFAETGKIAGGEDTGGEFDSPFEEAVSMALQDRGYKVKSQVGVTGFRIDLGILHPDKPGKFVLGIECDGAAYHSSRSARDRDRLRQQVLEGLGWQLYRIWSTDWFRRPTKEIERLVAAINKAIESRSEKIEGSVTVPLRITPEQTQTLQVNGNTLRAFVPQREAKQLAEQIPSKDEGIERLEIPYGEYHIPSYGGIMFTALPDSQLIDLVSRIVQHEAPIHLDEVARRLGEAFGLERITKRILNITEVALSQGARHGGICCKGGFWFASGRQLERPRSRRHAAPSLRKHEKIAPEEYRLAIRAALRESLSAERGELTALVARVLGFDRTGNGLERSISEEINQMLRANEIAESGGRLAISQLNNPN
jgi:very-short-patch-repair endonuclease